MYTRRTPYPRGRRSLSLPPSYVIFCPIFHRVESMCMYIKIFEKKNTSMIRIMQCLHFGSFLFEVCFKLNLWLENVRGINMCQRNVRSFFAHYNEGERDMLWLFPCSNKLPPAVRNRYFDNYYYYSTTRTLPTLIETLVYMK